MEKRGVTPSDSESDGDGMRDAAFADSTDVGVVIGGRTADDADAAEATDVAELSGGIRIPQETERAEQLQQR